MRVARADAWVLMLGASMGTWAVCIGLGKCWDKQAQVWMRWLRRRARVMLGLVAQGRRVWAVEQMRATGQGWRAGVGPQSREREQMRGNGAVLASRRGATERGWRADAEPMSGLVSGCGTTERG